MIDTTSGNAKSQKLSQIQAFVDNLKMDHYIKEAYMTWDEYIQYEREEAAEEAAEEANRKVEEAELKAAEADRRAEAAEKEVSILKEKLAALSTANND